MTQKMNPEIKEKWIAALRSGDYKQGRSLLRSLDDKFCCLGVLCDLAVKDGIIPPPEINEGAGGYGYVEIREVAGLPAPVRKWSGVEGLGARPLPRDKWQPSLSRLNDNGTSFAEIADIIEKEF